jgi:uncharacterized alkaline shock family protein YloU
VNESLGKVTIAPNVLVTIVQKATTSDPGVDLLQMGRSLQNEITRAIQDIVGMEVREVNIHIEDIATELSPDVGKQKESSR